MTTIPSPPAVPLEQRAKSMFDLVKDATTVVRDLCILALFIGLVFFPRSLNSVLNAAGFSQISAAGVTWKSQVEQAASQNAAAGKETTNAAAGMQEVKAKLQTIVSGKDPAGAAAAREALQTLDGTLTSIDNASRTITSSFLAQQALLQSAAPAQDSAGKQAAVAQGAGLSGWVYLGEADKEHAHWITPPQPKIDAPTPVLKVGDTITLTDDLFVRADKGANQIFNQAPTLGAVRAGSTAKVLEVRPSHALNGGDFLWVKIQASK